MKKRDEVTENDNVKKRGSYTNEQKMEAVRLLADNNYNYYKTSKETGIARVTLEAWNSRFGTKLANDEQILAIGRNVEQNLAKLRGDFLRDKYRKIDMLADAAIAKAMELLANEKHLSNVTELIRAINDFVRSSTEPGESGEGERSAQSLMIEKAIMHINQAAHL